MKTKHELPELDRQFFTMGRDEEGRARLGLVLCVRCESRLKLVDAKAPDRIPIDLCGVPDAHQFFSDEDLVQEWAGLTCASCGKPERSHENSSLVWTFEAVMKARELHVEAEG